MLGLRYFNYFDLFLSDYLHVVFHIFDLLSQVADVIVGLFDAVIDEVDQIIDFIDL
jgi:phage-related protein